MATLNEYYRNELEKPPLGLTPKWVIEEHRMQEIHEAVMRYRRANKEIPTDWLNEYITLASRV